MKREFLEELLGQSEATDAILAEHGRVVAKLGAEAAVKLAVTAAGGRNLTAIRALLDETAIAGSEDMDAAAQTAVRELRRSSPYLFESAPATAPGTGGTVVAADYTMEELGKLPLGEYRRYRKGR